MYNCDSFESVLIVLNIYYILTQKIFKFLVNIFTKKHSMKIDLLLGINH